ITKKSKVKSKNLEVIRYNSEVIRQAIVDADQNPRISLWSPTSAAVLKYLRKTKPEFSISEEAGSLLEEAIIRKYPDLCEEIKRAKGGD
ncbi:MAG TPA: hypothetical protein VN455_00505, partial [Methanotrichaceae archaeon]|nr:hypothetical protein [Methanotrichaceae archaeon]